MNKINKMYITREVELENRLLFTNVLLLFYFLQISIYWLHLWTNPCGLDFCGKTTMKNSPCDFHEGLIHILWQ